MNFTNISARNHIPYVASIQATSATSSNCFDSVKEEIICKCGTLKTKLKENVSNPYLLNQICNQFKTACASVLNLADIDNLLSNLTNHDFPEAVQANISTFAKDISDYYKQTHCELEFSDAFKKQLESLAEELFKIAQPSIEEFGWPEVKILLNLPQILKLDKKNLEALLALIQKSDEKKFKEKFHEHFPLKSEEWIKIKTELEVLGYEHNWPTLIAEIFRSKPEKKQTTVFDYLQLPLDSLADKIVHVKRLNLGSYTGRIAKVIERENSIVITLEDQSILSIDKITYALNFTISQAYPSLRKAVETGALIINDRLRIRKHINRSNVAIPEVEYRIAAIDYPKEKYAFVIKFASTDNCLTFSLGGPQESRSHHLEYISSTSNDDDDENNSALDIPFFDHNYQIYKLVEVELHQTDRDTIDTILQIHTLKETESEKSQYIERELLKEIDELRSRLQADVTVLPKLCDHFAEQRLSTKEVPSYEKLAPDYFATLRKISDAFRTKLRRSFPVEEILEKIILDALEGSEVTIEGSLATTHFVSAISETILQAENLKNQNVVLFLGPTGAGKSTSINYLLKAPLEVSQNSAGESVIRFNLENEKNQVAYPEIGHSLANSKTIYTSGYKDPDRPHFYVDCPGFDDTRGGEYQICAKLGTDLAVENAKQLLSVVLVIPAASFFPDRGNRVIAICETVFQQFPSMLRSEQDKKRLFLIISKENEVDKDVLSPLKNGKRFDTLVTEAQSIIEDYNNKRCNESSMEVQAAKKRLDIWVLLQNLHNQKRIGWIGDCVNQKLRNDLSKMYSEEKSSEEGSSKGGSIDRTTYQSRMTADDYNQLAKATSHSAIKWSKNFIEDFRLKLPQKLDNEKKAIELAESKKKEAATNLSHRNQLQKECDELKILTDKIGPSKQTQNLTDSLQAEIAGHLKTELTKEDERLRNLNERKATLKAQLAEFSASSASISESVSQAASSTASACAKASKSTSAFIYNNTSIGTKASLLLGGSWGSSWQERVASFALRAAFAGVLAYGANDPVEKDFTYRRDKDDEKWRNYLARGKRERRGTTEQKQDLEKDLATVMSSISGVEERIALLTHAIENKERNEDFMGVVNNILIAKQNDIQGMTNESQLIQVIDVRNNEIKVLRNSINDIERKRRNIAILIKTQWSIGEFLFKFFTETIQSTECEKAKSLQEFLDSYQEHGNSLLTEIDKEYKF